MILSYLGWEGTLVFEEGWSHSVRNGWIGVSQADGDTDSSIQGPSYLWWHSLSNHLDCS